MINFRTAAFLISLVIFSMGASGQATPPVPAANPSNQTLKDEVERLKEENQLRKEQLDSTKNLLESQRELVNEHKELAASQKLLLDALFPQIQGGKTGDLTFSTKDDIAPLLQPAAVDTLNQLSLGICESLKSSLISKTPRPNILVIGENDIKLAVQYRLTQGQLKGLVDGYTQILPKVAATNTVQSAIPAGLLVYGTGLAVKQMASFLTLFWSDREIHFSTVSIDERSLLNAVAGCSTFPVKTAETAFAQFVVSPATSSLNARLEYLSSLRNAAAAHLLQLDKATDNPSISKRETLLALNTQYDTVIEELFSVSEQKKHPAIVNLILGEAIAQTWTDDSLVLGTRVMKVAGVGMKKSSLWHSDRLHSGVSLTVSYQVIDRSGFVLAAGVRSNSLSLKRVGLE